MADRIANSKYGPTFEHFNKFHPSSQLYRQVFKGVQNRVTFTKGSRQHFEVFQTDDSHDHTLEMKAIFRRLFFKVNEIYQKNDEIQEKNDVVQIDNI